MESNMLSNGIEICGKEKILDVFIKARTGEALDKAVDKSSDYQDSLNRQEKALDQIDNAGLTKEQKVTVDRAVSATNDCGAIYGEIAYRLGFYDGIRIALAIKEVT